MSLVPTSTDYIVERGDRGVVVFAVQKALTDIGLTVSVDEVFGDETAAKVRVFQNAVNLKADGRFGPVTSSKMAAKLASQVSGTAPGPLVRGIVKAESAEVIGAVNTSVPGGIDCGYVQRRVYSADFDNLATVRRAFDGLYQMNLLATSLRNRHDAFFGRPGARTHERAWRLAALYHNYPYAAEKISQVGVDALGGYWTTPINWVEAIGAKFPDGEPVRTPLEWCQYYALGSSSHDAPGVTTQFVTSWPS